MLVDAANVIGSRPTGWWRDRAGAARDLSNRVRAAVAASRLAPPVVLVLEGEARDGVEEGAVDGVEIVHAEGSADDALVDLALASTVPVVLVSADRALAQRVRQTGGEVVGPQWLLERLAP